MRLCYSTTTKYLRPPATRICLFYLIAADNVHNFYPAIADEDARICGACLKNPPPFDLTHALFPYQPPIMQLIIALKFQHQLSYAQALGEWLTQAIQQGWYRHQPLPDLIIPVPLHPRRLRERGFNQALEIARPIAAYAGSAD